MTPETSRNVNAQAPGERRKFVTFRADGRAFGIAITSVREIRHFSPITAVPGQPGHMLGVLNLRGTIVPVHDLRARLGGSSPPPTPENAVVIALTGDRTIGLVVDRVSDIVEVPSSEIRPLPPLESGGAEAAVQGIVQDADGMVAILDVAALFPDASGGNG